MILRKFFLKNWRMRILSAVFFLSFLAGKFKIFKQVLQRLQILKTWHIHVSRSLLARNFIEEYFEQILRNDKLAHPVYINVFKVTGFPIKLLWNLRTALELLVLKQCNFPCNNSAEINFVTVTCLIFICALWNDRLGKSCCLTPVKNLKEKLPACSSPVQSVKQLGNTSWKKKYDSWFITCTNIPSNGCFWNANANFLNLRSSF